MNIKKRGGMCVQDTLKGNFDVWSTQSQVEKSFNLNIWRRDCSLEDKTKTLHQCLRLRLNNLIEPKIHRGTDKSVSNSNSVIKSQT